MKILVIDCGSTKVPDIVSSLPSNIETEVQKMDNIVVGNDFNGIIISGAPILLTNSTPEKYTNLFKPILHVKIPVLGICFGHQILGLLSSAQVSLCTEDRSWNHIEITGQSPLFNGLQNPCKMMEDHCEIIDLPKGYKMTAKSDRGLEGMEHETKPIFGVQFHPEVSGQNGHILMGNFVKICTHHTR